LTREEHGKYAWLQSCDPVVTYGLEVATPTQRPFSGRGCHALSWRSHGHSLAAYLWRHLRQTVVLPGKCTVWRRWHHR